MCTEESSIPGCIDTYASALVFISEWWFLCTCAGCRYKIRIAGVVALARKHPFDQMTPSATSPLLVSPTPLLSSVARPNHFSPGCPVDSGFSNHA